MNDKKKYLIVKILCVVLLIALFGKGCLIPFYKTTFNQSVDREKAAHDRQLIATEYMTLFKYEVRDELHLSDQFLTEHNYPLVSFTTSSGYTFIVHRFKCVDKINIESIVNIVRRPRVFNEGFYRGYDDGTFAFNYSSEQEFTVGKVSIYHDSRFIKMKQVFSNMVVYEFEVNKLSISLLEDRRTSMYFEVGKPNYGSSPKLKRLNVGVLKRDEQYYIVISYANVSSASIDNIFEDFIYQN